MGVALTDEEKKAIGVPHTKVYKALVYFGQALDALDSGKWKEANEFFNMAYFVDESALPVIQDAIKKAGGSISHNDLVNALESAGKKEAAASLLP
jgi:hypothetical protein